jgi:hypothetical protein
MTTPPQQTILDATRQWISALVIGLNLCPFARRVFEAERIRYCITDVNTETSLLDVLTTELTLLAASPINEIETTLVIHPGVLQNFIDYNNFLDRAELCLADLHLEGIIQIATFHPAYQFAGTAADALENYTNRSPYPMLHLLREESISRVATDQEELLAIPERNIAMLNQLGRAALLKLLQNKGSNPTS